jgi:hypothetical protein
MERPAAGKHLRRTLIALAIAGTMLIGVCRLVVVRPCACTPPPTTVPTATAGGAAQPAPASLRLTG